MNREENKKKRQDIIIANVDLLLKQRNEKVSDLEEELDIGAGYISRIRNNKVFISLDLLEKISEHFCVSIDYLLHNSISCSSDKSLLVEFFEAIYQYDCDDQLYWRRVKIDDLHYEEYEENLLGPIEIGIERRAEHEEDMYPKYIFDKIKKYDYDEMFYVHWLGARSLGNGREINGIIYTREELAGDYFCTKIKKEDISCTLYLYKVYYSDEERTHRTQGLVEAYIESESRSHYLCNSLEDCSYIKSKLNDLYQVAINKSDSNKLDEPTRSLLRHFTTISKK